MQQGDKQDGETGRTSPEAIPLSVVALDSIEHHYVAVLKELAMEPNLEPFKEEYEKIHRLLRKSNDGEKRLLQKIKELQQDLTSHGAKVEAALKLSHEDEEVIAALRKEIEKAWALADSAHAHEKESREHIQVLRKQVSELDALVDKSMRNTMGQEAYLRDLIMSKKDLENERVVAQGKVARLLDERDASRNSLEKTQKENEDTRRQLEEGLLQYQKLLRDLAGMQQERESLEQQVRECRAASDQHMAAMEERKATTEQLAVEEGRLKTVALEERDAVGRLAKKLEEQQRRFKTEADRLATIEAQNAEVKVEIPKLKATLKERMVEVARLAAEMRKVRKSAENQQTEMKKQLQIRDTLVQESEQLHDQIEERLRALGVEEKELHAEELRLKQAIPEKTQLLTDNSRTENERMAMEGHRVAEEGKRHNLAQQLDQLLRDNEQLRKNIFLLEQGQTKVLDHGQHVALQYHQTLEQTRKQRDRAQLLQQQLTENEKRLKAQQDLLDRVCTDRSRTQKQLKESELEWAGLKQRYQSNEEDIQLLKMQLVSKEGSLCRMHMVRRQLQRDISNAEQRASHLKDDGANATSRREALEAEAQQLNHLIAECDAEKSKYQSKFTALVNERNVLATQLIRRNEELRLLYSKIRLQECSLEKGAADYDKRVRTVMATQQAVAELRLRCRLALVRLRYAAKLQRRKQNVERDLFIERQRSRALADELQRPVHVHRWRRMEGNAPEVLDGIYKVQTLERQILAKHDALAEKTRLLAIRTAEYEAVRRKLAALPGPEVAEELSLYNENLERRRAQIGGMESELREVEQHADVIADEVKQLTLELGDVKRRYFDAKHKNDLLRREQAAFRATWGGSSAVANIALAAASAHRQQNQQSGQQQQQYPQSSSGVNSSARNNQQGAWTPHRVGAPRTCLWYTRTQQRREQIRQEAQLVQALSTGAPAPNYPLQFHPRQRQFVGGGFALTR
ncbi:Trypanosoma vivax [Trypanosoma theileri]|uniref:Trypanosoma vivax n=1 Tax=Trypanosoma theileri TaxID=67003 RepID=A0A1X0P9K9_9TRYP|nr:Trypanosoma vivax [Trypanosoma theileri]ORC93323.1 Trypanosoma vivax [Trypanosoma theileri]